MQLPYARHGHAGHHGVAQDDVGHGLRTACARRCSVWPACGYGSEKAFDANPDVYDIVDNTLYFNLDTKIRAIWAKDITGNIDKAETH